MQLSLSSADLRSIYLNDIFLEGSENKLKLHT